jgi:hypothetical protein
MSRKIAIAVMLLTAVEQIAPCAGDMRTEQDPQQVQQWVADLNSGQFAVRQQASRKLRDAGLVAVSPLVAAADGRQSEVTRRAVDVLDSLCESDDEQVVEAAKNALEQLVHSTHRLPAHRASVVLRGQRLRQQRAALVEILRLGGTVTSAAVDDGELVVGQLLLGHKWEAGDDGLRYLVKLGRIETLKLYGSQFTDSGLEHLTKLAGVQLLKLYATQITDDGQQRLQLALPGTLVDRRHGALLGVSGVGDAKGCRLSTVRDGTAAHRAGLEVEDVITGVNGTPIPNLETLIATIAKRRPGDRVKITFLRGDQPLERSIVLGELGEDME